MRNIQQRVGVEVDGIYGPRTERAVKNAQFTHGLVVDGEVGRARAARSGCAGTLRSITAETAQAGRARTCEAGTHASSNVTPSEG